MAPKLENETRKPRVPWEDDERRTVLIAVDSIGLGRWAEIRDVYPDVFVRNNRTNVHIKDQFRTLVNRGLAR